MPRLRRKRSGAERRPALAGSILGDLEGPVALIDERGRIAALDDTWRLEWGVGAEDRWHVAHREMAVRQHRVGDAPVYSTWMRVPGGDVIERVAAVSDGVGRSLLIEFENASAAAVTVVLVGTTVAGGSIEADAHSVTVDGAEWIRAERPAGAVIVAAGDPWPVIKAGPDASRAVIEGVGDRAGGLLVALPHRQSVRFLVALEGELPSRWVTPDVVAAGWRIVTADALSIDVPDADLGEAWRRIVPDLIVQAGSSDPAEAAEAAWVLDVAGLHDEADRGRAIVVAAAEARLIRGRASVAALRALASRELRAGKPSGLHDLAGPLADLAGDALDAETLGLVALALESSTPEAADDARRAMTAAPAVGFEPMSAAAVAAGRVLGAVIDDSESATIVLLPNVPDEWRGRSVDVRGWCSLAGRVSFSVRWHGERPALLWEREGGRDAVELRCPGLDPTWSTLEREGEALLAAPGR